MHEIGAEVLDGDFSVCHPLMTNVEMTNVDMAGPFGSGPTSLH